MFKRLKNSLRLGRVFRRLGLPPLTFLGIGISALWFNYLGAFFQTLIRDLLHLNSTPFQPVDYIPTILSALLPFLSIWVVAFSLNAPSRSPSVEWGASLQRPQGKKGLILLATKSNTEGAQFAIRYHLLEQNTLETVWIIPSDSSTELEFGEGTYSNALKVQIMSKQLAQDIGKPLQVYIRRSVSPADSQDTFDEVNSIFRRSGYKPWEIIADFTGGTKPMSVGMIMACLKSDRELEYAPYNKQSHGPFLVDYQYSAFDLIG
jgi:CRISPR-associated protein (Cas_Cas02710)